MEWEELFVNGIYDFGGKSLPIDREKTLRLICERDALEAFIFFARGAKKESFSYKNSLNKCGEIRIEFICYICGLFGAQRIYKHLKANYKHPSSNFDPSSKFDEELIIDNPEGGLVHTNEYVFKGITQHFYGGLIKADGPRLFERIMKFLLKKNEIKHLRRIRITTFLFESKNYEILEKVLFLLKPEAISTALTDAINADVSVYEFALKFVQPADLLEIVLYGAYERDLKIYKDKIKFLRDKLPPPHLERLNKECFKLLGVFLSYF